MLSNRTCRSFALVLFSGIMGSSLFSSFSHGRENSCPEWTTEPPAEILLEEGRQVVIELQAQDPDSHDLLTLTCEEEAKHSCYWNENTSPSNPVYGEFRFVADSCDDYENGPDYTLTFVAHDNCLFPATLACTARTIIHLLNNDSPQITEVTEIPACFHEGEILFIDVTVTDPDDYPYAPEGQPGEIEIGCELILPDPSPGPYDLDFSDNGDGTAVLRFAPHTHFVPAPDTAVGHEGYEYVFDIVVTASDKCGATAVDTIAVDVSRRFLVHPRTVNAYVGQQHVKVPFLLWNCEHGVAGWDLLLKYDDTAGRVIGVELCDSVYLDDPARPGWYYSPWVTNADIQIRHFAYDLNPQLRAAYLRVVGLLNLPGSQDTLITIPPSEEWLLFCIIYEMSRSWDGHPVFFEFETNDCPDNTLSDSTGYIVWGPDTLSAPAWTCPPRLDSLRMVTPIGGYGIRHQGVSTGDLNCNGISYEIGDAVVFVEHLVIGDDALCKGDCSEVPDCVEYQTMASDINHDEVYWNVSDLVRLLNLINGTYFAEPYVPGSLDIEVRGETDGIALSVSSQSTVGAALFVFDYSPEMEIGVPVAGPALSDLAMRSSRKDGTLRVLVYSPVSEPLEASGDVLFTIPLPEGWTEARPVPLTLREASVSDSRGFAMPLSTIELSPSDVTRVLPQILCLDGNYPNPFRNRTTIAFHLYSRGHVTLRAYNSAGQLTSVLIDALMNPGHHRVPWNAAGLPSGLYFYTLQFEDASATRRAVLLR